jgi:hypothetical protein
MEQGLLLEGVNVCCTHARVHQRVIGSATILPHTTISALSISHRTFARAQLALDLLVLKFLVELGFDGESRIILLLRTSPRRDRDEGLGKFADA